MPSLRHAAVAAYVHRTRHLPPARDVAEVVRRTQARRATEDPQPPAGLGRRCAVHRDDTPGFPVWTVAPREGRPGPEVVYLHGGAYVADLDRRHWRLVEKLVRRTGARVRVPQYPLAPEASWRDSRQPLLDLATRLAGEGPLPWLVGDSAGGGLALALAVDLAKQGRTGPGLVLLAPWVDLTVSQGEHLLDAADDPWLEPETLRHSGSLWAGEDDPLDPRISPLLATEDDLAPLPRTLVLVGTRDVLCPQVVEQAERLRAAGVPVELVTEPGVLHVYPLLPCPEGARGVERIARFLSS